MLKRAVSASPSGGDPREFVLSDATVDRMGEVIEPDGWDWSDFQKNPVALFNHNADFPIGTWSNLRKGDALRGDLEMAPAGTSQRIDEIRKLIDAKVLRAVSVGFKPTESVPINKDAPYGPQRFLKQTLVECSLVSVPANPNAIAVAKSLNLSDEVLSLAFGEHAITRSGGGYPTGKQAVTSPIERPQAMLSQHIERVQADLNAKRDRLAELSNAGEIHDIEAISDLNTQIGQAEHILTVLRESEARSGAAAVTGTAMAPYTAPASNVSNLRPATPASVAAPAVLRRPLGEKEYSLVDLMARAAITGMFAQAQRKPIDEVRQRIYGDHEGTRQAVELFCKAATAPAMTTVAGWAQELAQTVYTGFMPLLMPQSVMPRLSTYGMSLSFGMAGRIVIPTRARTPTVAGSFVGEGLPIPVRQGLFTSQTLTPKKMAVLTTYTREMSEHSIPAIQALLTDAIREDTAVSLDSILLDANPATAVRPPGILNGVSGLTPTAGGGFTAAIGDIKQLTNAILTGTLGNLRNPVWIMNPTQVNSLGLIAAPGAGLFPFREEVAAGTLGGWPIISSGTVPVATVIAIDAADFVSVGGDAPRFEISDEATIHMEDTTPLDIGTPGTPPVVAAPVKSMFQTNSIALRLLLDINWTVRRAGVVAWVASVTW